MPKTFVKICLIWGEAWVKGQGHRGQKVQIFFRCVPIRILQSTHSMLLPTGSVIFVNLFFWSKVNFFGQRSNVKVTKVCSKPRRGIGTKLYGKFLPLSVASPGRPRWPIPLQDLINYWGRPRQRSRSQRSKGPTTSWRSFGHFPFGLWCCNRNIWLLTKNACRIAFFGS